MEIVSDKALLTKVNQRLARMGGAQGKVVAVVRSRDVTLTGTIQFEIQRRPITNAASSVDGIRRVIDQMTVLPAQKKW